MVLKIALVLSVASVLFGCGSQEDPPVAPAAKGPTGNLSETSAQGAPSQPMQAGVKTR